MQLLRKIGTHALLLVVTSVCLSLCSGVARADSVTYTFTGSGLLAGTSFTYVSPSGFISSPTGELTVNPGGILNFPTAIIPPTQTLTSFAILPDTSIPSLEVLTFEVPGSDGAAENIPILPVDLSSFGTQEITSQRQIYGVYGTLVISPTVATPEPSSLALLLWGMLGLGFLAVTRKAFRPAKHSVG